MKMSTTVPDADSTVVTDVKPQKTVPTKQAPVKSDDLLVDVISRKEIPVEWEIVRSIYRGESWSTCFNCFNLGEFFVYTNQLENISRRSLKRLELYLEDYGDALMDDLIGWGDARSFEAVSELFSTCNFRCCRHRIDIVHYRGRSYLVHLFFMNEHACRWIDASGNVQLDSALSDTVVVYMRSIDSTSIAHLQRNLTLTLDLFNSRTDRTIDVYGNLKWIGVVAKYNLSQIIEKEKIAQIEEDLSIDDKFTVRVVECQGQKYRGIRKFLTRRLLSSGKVWGYRPCIIR